MSESKNSIDKSIVIFIADLGEKHVYTAEALFEKALCCRAEEDQINAQLLFNQCYEIRLEKLGADHPDTKEVLKEIKK